MVRIPDEQSFASLTLTELLHPEAAEYGIVRRHGDESPWATVYYEAVAGPMDYENMPVATNVVAVDDNETANPQQPHDIHSPQRRRTQGQSCELPTGQHPLPKVQPWRHSNLIDLILGFAFSLSAFICTIKIELTAIIIYTIAAGFHYLADEVFHHQAGMLGRSICILICSVLMIVDPILLTVSLLVTELIGGLALLLCSLSGGPKSGQLWHQFIRKTCHLSRWGFRNCHKGWKPERIFPISLEAERSHLHVVPSTEPQDEYRDLEFRELTDRDENHEMDPGSQLGRSIACMPTEESTIISAVTFLVDGEYEHPPIAISPENVTVVEEAVENQQDHEPLFKNTQHVTIS